MIRNESFINISSFIVSIKKYCLVQLTEIKCGQKCKEMIQQETDSIKVKYEGTIKSMTAKLAATETQNMEYSKAIKVPQYNTQIMYKQ